MTEEEKELVDLLGTVYTKFNALPILNQSDVREVVFHVHAIQNTVMSRVAIRQRAGIV